MQVPGFSVLGDLALQRAARNSVGSLAMNGFRNEGLYLAVKTLAEGWHKPAADSLVSGFREALNRSGDLEAWQQVAASRQTKETADDLISQMMVQSPEAYELIKQDIAAGPLLRNMGRQVVFAGNKLVELGLYDAGLSLLSSATYDKLAGVAAIPFLRDAMALIGPRDSVTISGSDGQLITRDLATAAVQLAETNHYVSALHTNLLEPLIVGDINRFAEIGKFVLDQSLPGSVGSAMDPMDLVLDLSKKGYRGQAIDLLTSATGVPYDDYPSWERMYEETRTPQQISGTGRFATSIAPSLVRRAGVDLTPPMPAAISVAPRAATAESSRGAQPATGEKESNEAEPGARAVNCAIERQPDYEPNRFDLRVNIGPKEDGSIGGRFAEPDWAGREFVDLRIVVSGPEVQVRPAWRNVRLPRIGKTDDVRFQVTTSGIGPVELWVRIYAEEANTLLDEHLLRISPRTNERGLNNG